MRVCVCDKAIPHSHTFHTLMATTKATSSLWTDTIAISSTHVCVRIYSISSVPNAEHLERVRIPVHEWPGMQICARLRECTQLCPQTTAHTHILEPSAASTLFCISRTLVGATLRTCQIKSMSCHAERERLHTFNDDVDDDYDECNRRTCAVRCALCVHLASRRIPTMNAKRWQDD